MAGEDDLRVDFATNASAFVPEFAAGAAAIIREVEKLGSISPGTAGMDAFVQRMQSDLERLRALAQDDVRNIEQATRRSLNERAPGAAPALPNDQPFAKNVEGVQRQLGSAVAQYLASIPEDVRRALPEGLTQAASADLQRSVRNFYDELRSPLARFSTQAGVSPAESIGRINPQVATRAADLVDPAILRQLQDAQVGEVRAINERTDAERSAAEATRRAVTFHAPDNGPFDPNEKVARDLRARVNGQDAGMAEYWADPERQQMHIMGLQTTPQFQGQGIASSLMDEIVKMLPAGWQINHGVRSEDGQAWFDKYSQRPGFDPSQHTDATESPVGWEGLNRLGDAAAQSVQDAEVRAIRERTDAEQHAAAAAERVAAGGGGRGGQAPPPPRTGGPGAPDDEGRARSQAELDAALDRMAQAAKDGAQATKEQAEQARRTTEADHKLQLSIEQAVALVKAGQGARLSASQTSGFYLPGQGTGFFDYIPAQPDSPRTPGGRPPVAREITDPAKLQQAEVQVKIGDPTTVTGRLAQENEKLRQLVNDQKKIYQNLLDEQKNFRDKQKADAAANPPGFFGGLTTGLTSSGFNGSNGGLNVSRDQILTNLGRTIGTTLKYTVGYQVLGMGQNAISDTAKQLMDFTDSLTDLNVAFGTGANDRQGFVNDLSQISRLSGSNVGEALDAAARGVRAFTNGSDSTQTKQDAGTAVAEQASQLSLITGQNLPDATGNIIAIGDAYGLTAKNLSQVNDAIAAAKDLGGFPKDIAQGLANLAVPAQEAGFSLNEAAKAISLVSARTDEGGGAVATRLSRVMAIFSGTTGQTALRSVGIDTSQSVRSQLEDLAGIYDKLGNAQQAQIRSALGGTANMREFLPLLQEFNKITSSSAQDADTAGRGLTEFNRRASDLTGTVKHLSGDLKNIQVGLVNTDIFAPLVIGLKTLEPLLNVLSKFIELIDKIPDNLDFLGLGHNSGPGSILNPQLITGLAADTAVIVTLFRRITGARAAALAETGAAAAPGLFSRALGVVGLGGGGSRAATVADAAVVGGADAPMRAGAAAASGAEAIAGSRRLTAAMAANDAAQAALNGAGDGGTRRAALAAEQASARLARETEAEVIRNTSLGGRQLTQELSLLANNVNLSGKGLTGALSAGVGALSSGVKGLGRFLQTGMGMFTIAAAGALIADELVNAGNKIRKATDDAEALLESSAGTLAGSTTDPQELRKHAADLRTAAKQTRDSSSGFFGTISNALSGNDTGRVANETDQAAAQLEAFANDLTKIRQDQAAGRRDDPSKVFDLTAEKGVANGLDLLEKSGRNAETRFKSLIKAFEDFGTASSKVAAKLSPTDQTVFSANLGGSLRRELQLESDILEGRQSPGSALDNALSFGHKHDDNKEQSNKLRDFLGSSQSADLLNQISQDAKDFQAGGGDVMTADGRAKLADIVKARLAAGLPQGLSDQTRKDILNDAINEIVVASGPFRGKALQGATQEDLWKMGPAAADQYAAERGLRASMGTAGGGTAQEIGDGEGLTTAKTALQGYQDLKKAAQDTAEKTGKPLTDGELENYDLLILQGQKKVEDATLTHLDNLNKLADAVMLSPFDGAGQIQAKLNHLDEQIATNTDPDRDLTLRTQRAQQVQAQTAYNLQLNADTLVANRDPRDLLGAAADAQTSAKANLKGITDSLKAAGVRPQDYSTSDDYQKAVRAVNDANVAAAPLQRQIADASSASGIRSDDTVGNATQALQEAQTNLDGQLKGQLEYYKALKQVRDAQLALANVQREAGDQARRATLDLTNSVTVANDDVFNAQEKLNQDRAAKAPDGVVNLDIIDLHQKQNAAEAAAFSREQQDLQTKERLGQITHQQFLSTMQGDRARLASRISAMKQTDNGYQQYVDELNTLDQNIKDALNQSAGQWNLGDIKVPTAYEMRRSLGADSAGLAYQSTSNPVTTVTNNISINGADVALVKSVLQDAVGPTAFATTGVTARKVI